MRIFTFIFSLFILVLSIVPCSDDENCNEANIELSSDHADHDHEEDSCTPFCTCSCCSCAGFVFLALKFHVTLQEAKILSPAVTINNSDFISNYFNSFWQPPKLS